MKAILVTVGLFLHLHFFPSTFSGRIMGVQNRSCPYCVLSTPGLCFVLALYLVPLIQLHENLMRDAELLSSFYR